MDDIANEITDKFNILKKKLANKKDLGFHDFEILLLASILEDKEDEDGGHII
jgi:hypothetical protein